METIIYACEQFLTIIESSVLMIVNKLASVNIGSFSLMYIIIIFVFIGSLLDFIFYLVSPTGDDGESGDEAL